VPIASLPGLTDGKPAKAVVEALNDKVPIRRATAAEALLSGRRRGEFSLVRYPLEGPQTDVRLRVGPRPGEAKDQEAVPSSSIYSANYLPPKPYRRKRSWWALPGRRLLL